MGYYDDQVRRDLRAAETELGQRRQAEARIRELHASSRNGDCIHCSERDYPDYAVKSPCPTLTALNGPES